MTTAITYETKHKGGFWYPSMGALGEVQADPWIEVRWNDVAETFMKITLDYAEVYHAGECYLLSVVWSEEQMKREAERWTPLITRRLEQIAREGQ